MRAMVLDSPGQPLVLRDWPEPEPGPDAVLVAVDACGVCRTDLHVVDGDLPFPGSAVIPGHEIVGRIVRCGARVSALAEGQRVGVPWLAWTCGACGFCQAGAENLCDRAAFTGYTRPGGFAEFVAADARYVFPVDPDGEAASIAPLLCAGLIGYRSYVMAGDARRLGLYGFGAAAHIVAQVAAWEGRTVFAFTKPGDERGQAFARSLGATWAGDSTATPPEPLDAAILFAPVGSLVPRALAAVRKGGLVVCAGIHMSDIPSFPYSLLWGERVVRSVANLTRRDGLAFLALAPRVPVRTQVERFPLEAANEALTRLREGRIEGAAVLVPTSASSRR
jgi:propanol-preferring alcohol dehydrogenase